MAEALAKHFCGTEFRAQSAGLNPEAEYDSKSAIATLRSKFGIDFSSHRQTNVRDLDLDAFTYVIAMDSGIAESLAELTRRNIVTWTIEDPWGGDAVLYYRRALDIQEQIEQFVKKIRARNERKTRPARVPR